MGKVQIIVLLGLHLVYVFKVRVLYAQVGVNVLCIEMKQMKTKIGQRVFMCETKQFF